MAITQHKHSIHNQTDALSKSVQSLNFCSIVMWNHYNSVIMQHLSVTRGYHRHCWVSDILPL